MKTILLFIILLWNFNALAQWKIQYFEGYSNFNKISFFDENTGLLMGDNATILKSENGGESWNKIEIAGNWIFQDFQFLTSDTLVALAHYYDSGLDSITTQVFNSFDTGDTWEVNSVHPGLQLISQWFFNYNIGLIAGYKGIFRTENHGLTWEKVHSYEYDLNGFSLHSSFRKLYFVNDNLGFAIEDNYETKQILIKTEDGGITWERLENSPKHLHSVNYLDENTGFVGSSNSIHKTIDGGVSWIEISLDNSRVITDLDFISSDIGFAIGSDLGIILTFESNSHYSSISKTIDGGNNWTTYSNHGFLYDFDFINEDVGFISGGGNLIMKTDNGNIDLLPEDYPWVLSIEEYPEIVNVFPNPTNGNLIVELAHQLSLTDFEIMTLEGKRMNVDIRQEGLKVFFDLSHFSKGIYILQARNLQQNIVKIKIVKV